MSIIFVISHDFDTEPSGLQVLPPLCISIYLPIKGSIVSWLPLWRLQVCEAVSAVYQRQVREAILAKATLMMP